MLESQTSLEFVTCSIGIAEFPMDGSTAEELLRVADKCLYEAKKQGRDCIATPVKLSPPLVLK